MSTTTLTTSKKQKMMRLGLCLLLALMVMPMFVYADTATDLFQQIIGTATKVFQYLGSFMFVFALGSLFLAFRNDDADSKSRSGMFLIVSILLISVPTIYEGFVGNGSAEGPLAAGNSLIGSGN